jgi:2-oxoglutarate ferredoxin oxidoreductase subunit alpha
MRFLWKIGGEAGFGIMTTGLSYSMIASRLGYFVFDYNEYPSLIRGGHNTYEVLVADEEVFASKKTIDLLVCLNQETFELHKHRLTKSSVVVYDAEEFEFKDKFKKVSVPLRKILRENKAMYLMANTIALGVTLGLLDGDIELLNSMIEKQFTRKGAEVVAYNKKFADFGFNHIKENYADLVQPILKKRQEKEKLVISGNDAFSLASHVADCRLYAAYPMTPTSQVLATLASWQDKTGMVVRHAEDEISVINTALGSSFAGVRSAVGTSGGGFALMVETLSFAGVAELPVVVFLGQRPGPATGMPTWTEQGDLLFASFAGHGEFPKIVLAPGDMKEMFELTAKAYDLADIYQTPVIVIADKFLCEAHGTLNKEALDNFVKNHKLNRGKTIIKAEKGYLRYKITEDGISPRLIPGQVGIYYQANSYDHDESGHTIEQADARLAQVEKRNSKWLTYLARDYEKAKILGDVKGSELVFVSWGANKGPIVEAQKQLLEKGINTGFIYFNHVFPMRRDDAALFTDKKRYVLVENNSHAQFGRLLAMETGIMIEDKILKYDGRPFYPEDIVDKVLDRYVQY